MKSLFRRTAIRAPVALRLISTVTPGAADSAGSQSPQEFFEALSARSAKRVGLLNRLMRRGRAKGRQREALFDDPSHFTAIYDVWAKHNGAAPAMDLLEGSVQAYSTLGAFIMFAMKRLAPTKHSEIPSDAAQLINNDLWRQFVLEQQLGVVPPASPTPAPAPPPTPPAGASCGGALNAGSAAQGVASVQELMDTTLSKHLAMAMEAFYDRELFRLTTKLDEAWHYGNPINPAMIASPTDVVTEAEIVYFAFRSSPTSEKLSVAYTADVARDDDLRAESFLQLPKPSEGVPSSSAPTAADAETTAAASNLPKPKPPNYTAYVVVRLSFLAPPLRWHDDFGWVLERMAGITDDLHRVHCAHYFCAFKASKVVKVVDFFTRMFTGKKFLISYDEKQPKIASSFRKDIGLLFDADQQRWILGGIRAHSEFFSRGDTTILAPPGL